MRIIRTYRGGTIAFVTLAALALLAIMPGSWNTAAAQPTAGPAPTGPAAPTGPVTVTVTAVVDNQVTTFVTTPGGLATLNIPPGSQITSVGSR